MTLQQHQANYIATAKRLQTFIDELKSGKRAFSESINGKTVDTTADAIESLTHMRDENLGWAANLEEQIKLLQR